MSVRYINSVSWIIFCIRQPDFSNTNVLTDYAFFIDFSVKNLFTVFVSVGKLFHQHSIVLNTVSLCLQIGFYESSSFVSFIQFWVGLFHFYKILESVCHY